MSVFWDDLARDLEDPEFRWYFGQAATDLEPRKFSRLRCFLGNHQWATYSRSALFGGIERGIHYRYCRYCGRRP